MLLGIFSLNSLAQDLKLGISNKSYKVFYDYDSARSLISTEMGLLDAVTGKLIHEGAGTFLSNGDELLQPFENGFVLWDSKTGNKITSSNSRQGASTRYLLNSKENLIAYLNHFYNETVIFSRTGLNRREGNSLQVDNVFEKLNASGLPQFISENTLFTFDFGRLVIYDCQNQKVITDNKELLVPVYYSRERSIYSMYASDNNYKVASYGISQVVHLANKQLLAILHEVPHLQGDSLIKVEPRISLFDLRTNKITRKIDLRQFDSNIQFALPAGKTFNFQDDFGGAETLLSYYQEQNLLCLKMLESELVLLLSTDDFSTKKVFNTKRSNNIKTYGHRFLFDEEKLLKTGKLDFIDFVLQRDTTINLFPSRSENGSVDGQNIYSHRLRNVPNSNIWKGRPYDYGVFGTVSKHQNYILPISDNDSVYYWDLRTAKRIATHPNYTSSEVRTVKFTTDNTIQFIRNSTTDKNKEVVTNYDLKTGKPTLINQLRPKNIENQQFNADSTLAVEFFFEGDEIMTPVITRGQTRESKVSYTEVDEITDWGPTYDREPVEQFKIGEKLFSYSGKKELTQFKDSLLVFHIPGYDQDAVKPLQIYNINLLPSRDNNIADDTLQVSTTKEPAENDDDSDDERFDDTDQDAAGDDWDTEWSSNSFSSGFGTGFVESSSYPTDDLENFSGVFNFFPPNDYGSEDDWRAFAVDDFEISDDHTKLLVGGEKLIIYDLSKIDFQSKVTHEPTPNDSIIIYRQFDCPCPRGNVDLTSDSKYALSGNSSIVIYDVEKGEKMLELFFFNNDPNKWVHLTEDGYFDASPKAMESMYWVKGLNIIEFSQLKDRYWVPGLWERLMDGKPLPIKKSRGLNDIKLYPKINLKHPTKNDDELGIQLVNQGGGYGPVHISINGKEVINDARGGELDNSLDTIYMSYDVSGHPFLKKGELNIIEVSAYNSEGYVVSKPQKLYYLPEGRTEDYEPMLHAIIVGSADYVGQDLDLTFPAKDARSFASALELSAKNLLGTNKTNIKVLTTDEESESLWPSKENIRAAYKEIGAQAKPYDALVLYFAGHGTNYGGQDGDFYFLTASAGNGNLKDPAIRKNVAIGSSELTEWIKEIPALKQVLIFDACHSGQFAEDLLAKRELRDASEVKSLERMKDRTGMYILSGSAADAVSYEASIYGQGLLTYSLLFGMKGASLRDNKFVDVIQLFQFAANKVPELAENIGGIQKPEIRVPLGGTSFDIGVLDASGRDQINLPSPKPLFVRSSFQNETTFDDNLELSDLLNEKLKSSQLGNKELVFVDASKFTNAFSFRGRYKQKGAKIQLRANLLNDGEVIETYSIKGASKQQLIEKLVEEGISEVNTQKMIKNK